MQSHIIGVMETSIAVSPGASPSKSTNNTGNFSPVSPVSSVSTDFITFKECNFHSPSWLNLSNKDCSLARDVGQHIPPSNDQNRPEDLTSFWQEFGFIFSVSMSQILTVTIRNGSRYLHD